MKIRVFVDILLTDIFIVVFNGIMVVYTGANIHACTRIAFQFSCILYENYASATILTKGICI
jgi:hypothetical protein